jgi:peptidoglycan-associated lipoprotein
MKNLAYAVLLAALLAGCAETPVQDASIEDRALTGKPAKAASEAKGFEAGAGVAKKPEDPGLAGTAAAKPAAKPGEKVETRGVAADAAVVKPLAGSQPGAKGPDGKPIGEAAQAGAPILDPKNPASPLAQRRILFDFDSAAIRDEFRGLLESHAQYMKKEKAVKVILQGHADERGSREYNLALGQRRSESVFKAFGLLGVADEQMEAVSFGEEKPIAEGHDEEAWKQNRRVEILYPGE